MAVQVSIPTPLLLAAVGVAIGLVSVVTVVRLLNLLFEKLTDARKNRPEGDQ